MFGHIAMQINGSTLLKSNLALKSGPTFGPPFGSHARASRFFFWAQITQPLARCFARPSCLTNFDAGFVVSRDTYLVKIDMARGMKIFGRHADGNNYKQQRHLLIIMRTSHNEACAATRFMSHTSN